MCAIAVAALVTIVAPVGSAQQGQHLWLADYNMEWEGPRSSGDVMADGVYQYRYTWRFGILNDPNGVLSDPTITVNSAIAGLQPSQPPDVVLNPSYPPFVWTGPQLPASTQNGATGFFTQLNSAVVTPPFELGYDGVRNLSGGPIAAGATETRTFTLTLYQHDAALSQMGGTVIFNQIPGPVTASGLSCSADTGSIGPVAGPGAGPLSVAWHIGPQNAGFGPNGVYVLTCSVTLANSAASPAVVSPNVVMSGRRSGARVVAPGTAVAFTSDPFTSPEDPLGTVSYDVAASGANPTSALDRHFTRTSFFNPINQVVDVTPPVTTAVTQPGQPNGTNGWFKTASVGVTLNATDGNGSGVKHITYSMSGAQNQGQISPQGSVANLSINAPGTTVVTFSATDNAGNVEQPKTITVQRDSFAPFSNASISPAPNASGWNNGPVTVTIAANDTVSGVAQICLTLSGATSLPQTCTNGSSVSFPVGANGVTNISFFAIDVAGNVEQPKSAPPVRIDTAPPATSAFLPPPNQFGWYTNDVTISLSAADASPSPFSGVSMIHYAINGVTQPPIVGLNGSFAVSTEGANVVQYRAEDRAGNLEAVKSLTINIDKTRPTVVLAPSYTTSEGAVLQIPVQGIGTPGETVTGLGCGVLSGAGVASYANGVCTYSAPEGPASATVGVGVSDGHGNVGEAWTTVTVLNVAPAITDVTGPVAPIRLGTAVTIAAAYSEPGVLDPVTCSFDWDDDSGVTSAPGEQGACSATHTYAAPGVYSVIVTVADDDGGVATTTFDYVVVYNPDAGSVTGGGTIAGADRANFGFNAKYQGEQAVGQTQFQVKDASLNFHSMSYDWLVVSGGVAAYEGRGTINGSGDYGFRVIVTDSRITGSAADTFRIQIWDVSTSQVIYDSEPGADDFALPTRDTATGNIVVHK